MDRDKILGAKTLKSEAVEVPEWDIKAYIRSLNAVERVEFFDAVQRIPQDQEHRSSLIGVLLLVNCLCDEHGNRILMDGDAAELIKQDSDLINRLCFIANRVNKIGGDSAEKK